jgi:hypothetical protein
LQTQLIIARNLRFGDPTKLLTAESLSVEVGKMLGGLSAYLAREVQANRSAQPNATDESHDN